ncbi:MAG: Na(+)/H(+) antiporter subunit B [Gammaproteobacteria bacterium]|nr:Na(+)/H(+) antiporter subunit B [Gammaproteobacteria bacterium]
MKISKNPFELAPAINNSRNLILEQVMPLLYGVILAAAVWILWRGHHAPGGGFIGGLTALAATAAQAIVFGVPSALRRMPLGPMPLAVTGVALALCSGLPATWFGHPYLTHLWFDVPLGFTQLPLSTVLLFDIGVFCAVWGTLSGYIFALLRGSDATSPGEQS